MYKHALTALALVGAMASAQANTTLIDEGFDSYASLAADGWLTLNLSSPTGTTQAWTQGNPEAITAYSGASDSYVGSLYSNAADGGTLSSWLLTPVFSTADAVTITFYAASQLAAGYADHIAFGIVDAAGNVSSLAYATFVEVSGDWTQYTLTLASQGVGSTARFAIEYYGSADASNYVGVDSLQISTITGAVPEPSSFALAGLGALGLAAWSRRRQQQQKR